MREEEEEEEDCRLFTSNHGITHFLGSSPRGVVLECQEAAKRPDNLPVCPLENKRRANGLTSASFPRPCRATAEPLQVPDGWQDLEATGGPIR